MNLRLSMEESARGVISSVSETIPYWESLDHAERALRLERIINELADQICHQKWKSRALDSDPILSN